MTLRLNSQTRPTANGARDGQGDPGPEATNPPRDPANERASSPGAVGDPQRTKLDRQVREGEQPEPDGDTPGPGGAQPGSAGDRPDPGLTEAEKDDVEHRSELRPSVVHEVITKQGEEELRRTTPALAWSGLAAGLSMGFSLLTEGLLRAHLPDANWRPLVEKLGYPVGFLIVILGRQQLFTENTLTVILPLMSRRDSKTLLHVLRLWLVVVLANLVGAAIFAWATGCSGIFEATSRKAFAEIGHESLQWGFGTVLLKGIFGGWLIALMVWMMPAAETARIWVIVILAYVVSLGSFTHVVAGSVDVYYLAATGAATWGDALIHYSLPALLGNVIGGVSLVAALNHAQVNAGGGSLE